MYTYYLNYEINTPKRYEVKPTKHLIKHRFMNL